MSNPSHSNQGPNMNYHEGELYHKPITSRPSNILLYTIINQRYVITIEAIYKISQRFGKVLRIVMIRKKGTQAMVEFETDDDANKAMEGLQNQDIYSGCCTLKVDYSRTSKLNVRKNDANSWDFTVQPNLTAEAARQPLISGGGAPEPYGGQGGPQSYEGPGGHGMGGPGGYRGSHGMGGYGGYNGGYGGQGGYNQGGYNQGGQGMHGQNGGRTPVAIIYGLTEQINCKHLFNVLCLYGNVAKVKFMKSKPGCAMVEFSDTDAVTKATKLSGADLFGSKLTVRPSKSMFVGEPKGDSFQLADDTPGFEDFTQSKFNRFSTAEKAQKNRAQEPRATIHFFNAPVDAEEEAIRELLEGACKDDENAKIEKFVMFPKKEKSKSTAGLVTFESVNTAMNCLALLNHKTMESEQSAYPYNVKFCFATQDLKE